jgi:hypothetical protein
LLGGLTTLDGDFAGVLAAYNGALSPPNLRTISPKTLVALLEKTDVHVPDVETLELIPEPDGSLTEDLGPPERFLERR